MKNYFEMQMDYIFFVYGLAFIGLSVVTYILSKEDKRLPWGWLALFGLTHGLNEWLDLLAISWGDGTMFAVCRWAIMTGSFLFLVEFGRLSLIRRRGHGPGPWLLGLLSLAAAAGGLDGWVGVNATCRYALGLVGGVWAGLELCWASSRDRPEFRQWLRAIGGTMILYALSAGLVVPRASFFPASIINHETFLQLTSLPIQLIRGLLALGVASFIAVYFQKSCSAENEECHAYRARCMCGAGISLIVILLSGWFLTQFMGNLVKVRVLKDRASFSQMASFDWVRTIEIAENAVTTLSASPWLAPAVLAQTSLTIQQANSVLDRYQKNFGASVAYLMDRSGITIASSNRNDPDSFVGYNYNFRPYFQQAMAGNLGSYFALGVTSKQRGYYTSYPVKDQAGEIAGVAVFKMGAAEVEQQLRPIDPAFIVDEQGIVFLSSRPDLVFKSLGPVPAEQQAGLARQYGTAQFQAIFPNQPANGSRVKFDGWHFLVCRQSIDSQKTPGWSMVSLAPMDLVFFYRLLGIAIAMAMVVLTLLFVGSNVLIREWAYRIIASEARFRAMFAAAPEAVLVIDSATREILDANPFVAGWLGYPLEELIGKKIDGIQDQQEVEIEEANLRGDRKGKILGTHGRFRRKDGALVDVETTEARLIYQDNIRRLFFVRDITERLQAEAALRDMTIMQQAILESANYSIISTTPAGIITTFNIAAQRWLGYTAAEVVGKTTPAIIHDIEEVKARADELSQELGVPVEPGFEVFVAKARLGGPDEREWTYIRKDGSRFPVLLSVTALRHEDGEITGFLGISSDITERQHAQEALNRLAAIVEFTDDAIIGKTLDGVIFSWNQGAERIYGYAAAEVLGRHISFLVPPDQQDEFAGILAGLRQGQRVQSYETVRIRKDGRLIDVSLTISPIRDAEGTIAGISTIARDITTRKQAEMQLRKFSRAVEQSPASVVITDPQGIIQYVNPKFTRITGYTAEEAIGKNPRILKSGDKNPEEYKNLWETITAGEEWRGEFHNKKKNGELYWESASISPIKDDKGIITHFIAVKEDITAMKAAREELAKLSLVASKTDNAVIITDHLGCTEWVNDGFTRLTGFTLEETVGKKPGAVLQGPESDRATIKGIGDQLRAQQPLTAELINYHKSGRPYWVAMDITPIFNDKGELTRFISIERNITQRKETEEALYQARKAADAANLAKSEFLASMSHEIRTPMNAIIGMADLLWETPLTQEQQQYVEVFRSAGETLLNLINDILDLSKVEAGQITLERIELDLAEIVEKVCEVMALKAHQKGLELACRIMPGVPTHLLGDTVRLRQILTNLVGNSIKFTERGEVVVEVTLAQEAQCPKDPAVPCPITFSIKDTGIGISPEKLEVIFEKFTQADTSTTRKYGGSGLGLAISKHLVELMGGELQVRSQVGQGSTFGFTIPFSRQLEPHDKPIVPAAELKDLRVLVVDDNATNRLILREIMTGWGARVAEAENGIQGLAELNRAQKVGQPYQLVLLDGRMPQMDGFGMAEAIHDDASFSGITVMMLTSDARTGDLSRARDLDLASYLVKPVKRRDLREAIDRALHLAHQDDSAAPSPAPVSPEEQRPLRILLADDSADNRLLIQAYLKKYPFQLDMAEDGEQALGKFQADSYDLVLMDMQMPVMDGYNATRRIREWERQQQVPPTPVIALTAYALKEEIQKSLDAGCTVHLTKPIKKSVLLEAIAQYSRSSGGE